MYDTLKIKIKNRNQPVTFRDSFEKAGRCLTYNHMPEAGPDWNRHQETIDYFKEHGIEGVVFEDFAGVRNGVEGHWTVDFTPLRRELLLKIEGKGADILFVAISAAKSNNRAALKQLGLEEIGKHYETAELLTIHPMHRDEDLKFNRLANDLEDIKESIERNDRLFPDGKVSGRGV